MQRGAAIVADEQLLDWLRQLVRERLSEHLRLSLFGEDRLLYRLSHGVNAIEFPAWEWPLGDGVDGCSWYDAARDGWRPLLGRPIPAPGLEELEEPVIESTPVGYRMTFDALGLAYWALSRCEEVGRPDLDQHGRFPALSSHAYKHGYLERPVVDEWFDLLKQLVKRLWPQMPVSERAFELRVSHDIDRPSKFAFSSGAALCRNLVGDLVKRREWSTACRRLSVRLTSRRRLRAADPFNSFEWIMSRSEHHDLKSTFYVVCGRTDSSRDPSYDVEHPAIRALLGSINERGHYLGLHPSYDTYRNPRALEGEARRLARVCAEERIHQDEWGCRMHYLRWATPVTLNAVAGAGLDYDSTLGYADRPGFRCGTCLDYQAFDPVALRSSTLRIRPLIAMEGTIISPVYLGFGLTSAAFDRFSELKNVCRRARGTFTLLWHNNKLATAEERDLYESVLRA